MEVVDVASEQFFTVSEVAEKLKVSNETVSRWFENRRGVIVLGSAQESRFKRKYRTIRIPESVLNRFVSERAVA